jgi:Meiotically up-regulated gene 113
MPVKVTCPGCNKTFNAPDEFIGKRVKCPSCKTAFVAEPPLPLDTKTVLKEPPSRPNVSPLPEVESSRDLFDYMVYFSLTAIPLLCLLALGSMLFGSGDVFLFLGGTCLLLSLVFLAKYSQMKAMIRKQREEANFLSVAVGVRTKDLEEAISKFRAFEDNFDSLIAKEFNRLEKRFADAEQMVEFAENREKTIDGLGKRFLNDSVKWVSARLTPNNFTASRDRLAAAVEFCRKHEYNVDPAYEKELLDKLKAEYESVLRAEHAREEQARIKARIREEQKAEKELEREMHRIEAEKAAIEKALQTALREAQDEHSAEIEALRDKLREAEEKAQRAMSMAQQTKAGHVYVISNIGSFGEEVFKIGMTRRLEPMDRVKELGDASVPFPFDVHMMISCDDAPSLENALHKTFHYKRLNKVNLRREFFRVSLDEIRQVVENNHGEVDYVAEPEALQYRESIRMSDEDFAYVSSQGEALVSDDDDEFVE